MLRKPFSIEMKFSEFCTESGFTRTRSLFFRSVSVLVRFRFEIDPNGHATKVMPKNQTRTEAGWKLNWKETETQLNKNWPRDRVQQLGEQFADNFSWIKKESYLSRVYKVLINQMLISWIARHLLVCLCGVPSRQKASIRPVQAYLPNLWKRSRQSN